MSSTDREIFVLGTLPALLADWRQEYSVYHASENYHEPTDSSHETQELHDPLTQALSNYNQALEALRPWTALPQTLTLKGKTPATLLAKKIFLSCVYFSLSWTIDLRRSDTKKKSSNEAEFSKAWTELIALVETLPQWSLGCPKGSSEAATWLTSIGAHAFNGKQRFADLFSSYKSLVALALTLTYYPLTRELEEYFDRCTWRASPEKMPAMDTTSWAIGEFAERNKIELKSYSAEAFLTKTNPEQLQRFVSQIFWPNESLFRLQLESWLTALDSDFKRHLKYLTAWKDGEYLIEIDIPKKRITNLRSKRSTALKPSSAALITELQKHKSRTLKQLFEATLGRAPEQTHLYFKRNVTALLEEITAEKLIITEVIKTNQPANYSIDPKAILLFRL